MKRIIKADNTLQVTTVAKCKVCEAIILPNKEFCVNHENKITQNNKKTS